MTTLLTQVITELKNLSDSALQICHNNYCDEIGYEDVIYDNDEYNINEMFTTPFDVLRNIEHYNLSDNYFYLHNGNLVSFDYLTNDDSPITFSELAQWIIDNDNYNDVTTKDDMYNAIMDNLEDASSLDDIINIAGHLGLTVEQFDINNESPADYECHLIATITDHVYDDETLLQATIEYMKIVV